MKLIECRVENIGRIETVELPLNGKSAGIGGKNGHGKSSLLNALKLLCGDKKLLASEPVRRGAKDGSVVAKFDNGYRVAMSITPERKIKFNVTNENGEKLSSSVALIKKLWGGELFDPGEWMSLSDTEKTETLKRIVGLDFSTLDSKRATAYEERRDIGREVKRLEGAVSSMPSYDVPGEIVSAAAIREKLSASMEAKAKKAELEQSLDAKKSLLASAVKEGQRLDEQIEQLMTLNKKNLEEQKGIKEQIKKARADVYAFDAEPVDVEQLQAELTNIDETNEKVRANYARAKLLKELEAARENHDEQEKLIAAIDAQKRKTLAETKFPVKGLSFDESGIRFNDSPLNQAGESAQWRVAVAMAFNLNPNGIVFMSNSGGLDLDSRKAIREEADKREVQYLFEVVDDAEDVEILISNGKVEENRLQ